MKIFNDARVSSQANTLHPIIQPKGEYSGYKSNPLTGKDTVAISHAQPSITFTSGRNFIHLVSFKGLKDPTKEQKPAIQMRVTGVSHHQLGDGKTLAKDTNVDDLSNSKWEDEEPLDFDVIHTKKGPKVLLIHPKFGELGRVPDEIAPDIIPLLEKNEKDFKFELSNIVAGTTNGAATTGLRVNLLYTGKDSKVEKETRSAFSTVLNNPNAAQKVLLYQPKTTPSEVLRTILDNETKNNGAASAKNMELAISSIVKVLDDPKNKKILLVSHCKPDGDTIGCGLGLKNAINLVHPEKQVDCAVDDDLTGLFRHKLPGVDDAFKHPYSQEKIDSLSSKLDEAKGNNGNPELIKEMEHDYKKLTDKDTHLKSDEKYDVVVLLDVPAPTRFTSAFKNYIQDAKQTVYIDHHPFRKEEWDASKEKTGVDMNKINKQHLAWIADRVPAAAQMVAILGTKLSPGTNPLSNESTENINKNCSSSQLEKIKGFAASLVTGICTDTGGFSRTANLVPEDVKDKEGKPVPIQWRPNYQPEGLAKWLLGMTGGTITKKWLRDEITYEIDNTKTKEFPKSALDQVIEKSEENKLEDKDLGFGIVKASYDDMKHILKVAQVNVPETNFLDVQNEFKYSTVMGDLRSPMDRDFSKNYSAKTGKKDNADDKDQPGPYENDKIAVLVCEAGKAGELDDEGQVITQDSLRFSFRSQDGSRHAELLASLFGGGGHGGAAGGNITMDKVDLDTKFAVQINGEKVTNNRIIYDELDKNYEMVHDKDVPPEKRETQCSKIKLVKDEEGKTSTDIIKDMVTQIRIAEPPF